MDKEEREQWKDDFSDVASKITEVAYELLNNKDVHEFIKEMTKHKDKLEKHIKIFEDVIKHI
jgi:hypothetical protein